MPKALKTILKIILLIAVFVLSFGLIVSFISGIIDYGKIESNQNAVATSSIHTAQTTQKPTVRNIESFEIYNDSNIIITVEGIYFESYKTYIKVLIENNSDYNYTFQAWDSSINGFMVDAAMSEDVAAHKKAYSEIKFFDYKLEKANIKPQDINNIEFKFHIFDESDWSNRFESDIISLTVGD